MARGDSDRCRELEAMRSLHASGDIEPDEARRIEAHLGSCAPCRQEVEVWRRQAERLGEWRRDGDDAPLSPFFWKALRLRISREPIPIERLRRRRKKQAWMSAAAAMVLGAGISFVAFSVLQNEPAPPAEVSPARGPAEPRPGSGPADLPVILPVEDPPDSAFAARPPEIPF